MKEWVAAQLLRRSSVPAEDTATPLVGLHGVVKGKVVSNRGQAIEVRALDRHSSRGAPRDRLRCPWPVAPRSTAASWASLPATGARSPPCADPLLAGPAIRLQRARPWPVPHARAAAPVAHRSRRVHGRARRSNPPGPAAAPAFPHAVTRCAALRSSRCCAL